MRCLAVLLGFTLLGCTPPSARTAAKEEAAKGDAKKAPEFEIKDPALLDPFEAKEEAPAQYQVKFETTKGTFVVAVTREWAPRGADRFYNLVKLGFFDDCAFFRAVKGFMVQFGLHGAPPVSKAWKMAPIKDDERKQPNKRGTIAFATSGPDERTTQVFINFGDNHPLDGMDFAPFGVVTEGMEVVDSLNTQYGDAPPGGSGPKQTAIERNGNAYLRRNYPKLDYIKTAQLTD